jgi:hypothetical protein
MPARFTVITRIGVIGFLILLAWFLVFGGEVFGPAWDNAGSEFELHQFLYNCPPDEMRLRFYSGRDNMFIDAVVNFTTRKLTVDGGGTQSTERGFFWSYKPRSVFHTISFPLIEPPASLTDEQVHQIKEQLVSLSWGESWSSGFDKAESNGYLAFYREGNLQIEQFSPGTVPVELRNVCNLINFGPIFDFWNSLRGDSK